MKDWPKEISVETVNIFTIAKLDPDISPDEFKVVTWSSVFGSGGSVSIDGRLENGRRVELANIYVKRDGSVKPERDHLEAVLAGWDGDWHALVTAARVKVRDYYALNAGEYGLSVSEVTA